MRQVTLGELCSAGGGFVQTGPFGSQLHASDYVEVGVPVVMPQDIGENIIVDDAIARVGETEAGRLGKHRLEVGDIVYSRRGDVERRALVRDREAGWLCGTGCLRVHFGSEPEAIPGYISYLLGLQSSRTWIRQHAVGATMLNINTTILSSVPLLIHDLPEQQAIAEVLGALDDKIAACERVAGGSESLAVSLVSSVDALVSLAEIASVNRQALSPAALGDQRVSHYSLPAYDAGQLPVGESASEILSNKFAVRRPSVLISKLNPRFPRVWNLTDVSGTSVASTEFVVLEPSDVTTGELWAALSQPEFGQSLADKASGTSGSHQRVKPQEILDARVRDPKALSDAQRELVTNLGMRAHAARLESQRLSALRDALLPELMSGRLRVKDAEKQVEEVL